MGNLLKYKFIIIITILINNALCAQLQSAKLLNIFKLGCHRVSGHVESVSSQ